MSVYRIVFRILSICLLLTGIGACGGQVKASGDAPLPFVKSLSKEARKAYQSGQGVLLFAFAESIRGTEAYADWAAYLNDFQVGDGATFYIAQVSAKDFRALGINSEECSLFFKKGYPSYFYEGLIVEPQVYTAVYKRYTDQSLSDMDKSFLPDEWVGSGSAGQAKLTDK